MSGYRERCVVFGCQGERLLGILAEPSAPTAVGVVIVVGGPQYRAGSHRQFALLARYLAAAGFAVLRFDYRGMGDSTGAARSFEAVSEDIDAAVEALQSELPVVQRVVLWGLCDGASAALLYCDERPAAKVTGLCLLNPWVRSNQSQAAVHVKHYYTRRLTERAFWMKLLRGQVGLGRLAELGRSLRTMLGGAAEGAAGGAGGGDQALRFQHRMARAWHRSQRPLLLVLSGQDLTAREFTEALSSDRAWRGALAHPGLTRVDLPEADHTFSNTVARAQVERATADWLGRLAEPGRQR